MTAGRKFALRAGIVAVSAAVATVLLVPLIRGKAILVQGAVIRQDADTRKWSPIAGAEVEVAKGSAVDVTKSDASGLFRLALPRLTMPKGFNPIQPMVLRFRHPEYKPLDLSDSAGDRIVVARMSPLAPLQTVEPRSRVTVSNLLIRYSTNITTEVNIGSAAQTFQAENTGNVPCNGNPPCSPDGKWKAALGSVALDAGAGNEFRNARVSCIAGPCPFTRIDDVPSRESRRLHVSALAWSDTATFLLEAEVYHPMVAESVRQSHPVIFGQTLSFTLPAAAEGVSIEAEIGGPMIIFPLGPDLSLSWADCVVRVNKDQTKVYQCGLKPGYQFP